MFSQVTKLIFHCPPHLQSQLAAITRQWQYYSQIFYHKLVGHYDELFHYNGPNKKDHFEGVCIFLESLARHLPPVQRKSILSEIAYSLFPPFPFFFPFANFRPSELAWNLYCR